MKAKFSQSKNYRATLNIGGVGETAPLRVAKGWYLHNHKLIRVILVVAGLLVCALVLSACSYPGQDVPCVGANRNGAGCTNPAQGITDKPQSGEWFVDWTFKILRDLLANFANSSVRLAISTFWEIFINLGSTDFAACGSSGQSGNNPTCEVVSLFGTVRLIAFALFPMLVAWKFFKSYFVGALIESVYESGIAIIGKLLIAGFVLASLDVLISAAFGLSNSLFEAILGSAQTLNDISTNILGSGESSGVGSVTRVENLGLLLFVTFVCLMLAIVFIGLGLVFFLRTILVFILFVLSPLAIVAGLSEEFREWFSRWLSSIQAMLIAPIPVAICFALIKSFSKTIPSAHDNPPEFILQMVYIIAFLAMGAILMFKIAGQVGGLFYGLAVAGASLAAGYATGGMSAALAAMRGGGGGNSENEPEAEASGGASTRSSSAANSSIRGSGNGGTSGSAIPNGSDGGGSGSGSGGGSALVGASASNMAGSAAQSQQLGQMIMSMRSLNESMQASMLKVASSTSATGSIGGAGGGGNGNLPFGYRTHSNVHSALSWAGQEAGVSNPYFNFAPAPAYAGYGSGGNGNGNGATSQQLEYYQQNYQGGQTDFSLGIAGGSGNGGEDGFGYGGGNGNPPPGPSPVPGTATSKSAGDPFGVDVPPSVRSYRGSDPLETIALPAGYSNIRGSSKPTGFNSLYLPASALSKEGNRLPATSPNPAGGPPLLPAPSTPDPTELQLTGAIPNPYGAMPPRPALPPADPGKPTGVGSPDEDEVAAPATRPNLSDGKMDSQGQLFGAETERS